MNPVSINGQRGAALIVGLVLMMVLTILAISTMRTSTLELTMAGNTQYREKARQLAEAGIADAIDQISNNLYDPSAVNPNVWDPAFIVGQLEPASGDTYSVDIRFLRRGDPPPGFGQGELALQANYFELQATGRTAARNARSVIRRGFWKFTD